MRHTADGLAMVESVVEAHMDTEREIVGVLSDRRQLDLAGQLRTLLVHLGDAAPI